MKKTRQTATQQTVAQGQQDIKQLKATYNSNSEKAQRFEQLKTDFMQDYKQYGSKGCSKSLERLAVAFTYSVLKKCIDKGYSLALVNLKNDIYNSRIALHLLDDLQDNNSTDSDGENTDSENGTTTTYNYDKKGNIVFENNGKETDKKHVTILDGYDLVQTAILAILEQARQYSTTANNWLDSPYEITRLSKKVYVNLADSKAYKTDVTTASREIFRTIRRQIMNSASVQVAQSGYSYIADYNDDDDDGCDGFDRVYYRLQKYADYGQFDSNGNYTVNTADVLSVEQTIVKMNLTDRQTVILKLMLSGYGQRAIATYLGISAQGVQKHQKLIQRKAIAIGLQPLDK